MWRRSAVFCRGPGPLLAAAGLALLWPATAGAEPPANPRVVEIDGEVGKPGGELRMLVSQPRDTRLYVVYGYARLVRYDRDLELVPDILDSIDVEDGRAFTLRLRPGHRWSDGHPFTAEDFRFWWEDVANNERLKPTGPEVQLIVDGEPPQFEVIDELTVRYAWSKPNPFFLPALAAATPLFNYQPAHYLKQFHEKYADPAELERMVRAENARDWAQLYGRKHGMYAFDNPDLPTLQPWRLVTRPPATRFVAERNPYFHRVDPEGRQLPYIDRFILDVVDSKLIPIKAGAGETDLQSRGLFFKHYPFLKESEGRNGLKTLLWKEARGAHLALYPNLNVNDPVWRELFRDARFRRALSLGVDRDEINQVLYFGLGTGGNNTVLPESPLYRPEYRESWAAFDPEQANALLDEIGLTGRGAGDVRLLPNGRPMEIIVETAGEDTEQTDALELVADSWRKLGIKLLTKPSQREVFRNRIFSGDTQMAIDVGLENGIPTADMSPEDFAPVHQIHYQWPKWGQYHETKGQAGEPPDEPEAQRLLELFERWRHSGTTGEREKIWAEMLQIHADQVYSIGLIAGVLQPIAVNAKLRNVPEEAIYNWEPGAQFGIYTPDTFWFDDEAG
ncbi:MAG TPA: ABC transporter substrate-binding protein [Geminicoccaceae bacterium]|nr:ABC transporter substrate-binding protein [Geminicoccaceae bacterium]